MARLAKPRLNTGYRFTPLEPENPSLLKTIAINNPLTAAGEAAINLGSQVVALPFAGAAGLGTIAANALGMGDVDPADVVRDVGRKMTYEPRGEFGKAAAGVIAIPFEKLAEVGTAAGDKTLETTGSPAAAAAVDTAINLAPMLIDPAARGVKAVRERFSGRTADDMPRTEPAIGPAPVAEPRGFIPLEDIDAQTAQTRVQRLAGDDPALHGTAASGMEMVRRQGDQGLPGMDGEFRELPPGYEAGSESGSLAGQAGREGELRTRQLYLDDTRPADEAARMVQEGDSQRAIDDGSRSITYPMATDMGFGLTPLNERIQAGIDRGTSGQALTVADSQRRDAAIADVGEANRPAYHHPLAEDQTGNAGRIVFDPETVPAEPRGFIPLRDSIDTAAHEAAASPLNDRLLPTPGQIEAGNYKKGTVKLHGLDIAIENPAGSIRSGISPEGKPWQSELKHHYGYFRQTMGKDGDPVDVFIGPRPESQRAFVIDQIEPKSGRFDEHKAVIGADSLPEAKAIYHANYEPGWKGAGAITEMPLPEFKQWLYEGDTKKPVGIKKLLGQPITEHTDAALSKLRTSKLLTEPARARVEAEIERRAETPETVQDMATGVQNGTWNPGAQYTPFVDQAHAPTIQAKTVANLPAPLRRERIIKELADALGTHVYEGRVRGEKRLGFFRSSNEEVRIKRAGDIEVTAHEAAHLIDSRVPEIRKAWEADKALREELRSVSYDKKNVKEGFAEAVRLWATQADALQTKAPKVHTWLENFANSHKYGPALRNMQQKMSAWFDQDALNRARSKIGDPGKFGNSPVMQHLGDWWQRQKGQWRQSISDDLDGIYRAERSLTGKTAPAGAYETARLSRAAASITDGAVRFGAPLRKPDGSYTFTGKGLHEILQPVSGRIDDFMLYAVGRSAQELMTQKREHLFSNAEIKSMVALETPEFRKALNLYQDWNRAVVSFAEQHGVINTESRAMWNRQIYLPFWRVSQPGEWKGAKAGDWKGVQALTGGTSNIRDVLSNVIGNANLLITKALVNDARARTVKLIEENKGGRYLVEIPKESRPVKISGDQVAEAMLKRYGIALNDPGYFEFMLTNQAPAGGNIIAVLENGKPRYFEVGDPLLFRSLVALERPPQHWLVKWLGIPKRLGQASIVLDPTFIAGNLARDQVMSAVMSQSGFRPMIDAMAGLRSRVATDPLYREWIANGGGLSSLYLEEAALRKNLDRFYAKNGINAKTVLDTPGKMLYFVEWASDAIESASRIGEFGRALERGDHPRAAAYKSREVSVDWATKGDSKALSVAFDTVIFLRAAVVSMDRVFRGVAHDPNRGAIAIKAGTIALASTALYLMNRGNPAYDDMEDWKKDAFWHVWIGGEHFMMPKAFEVGALASIGERTVERLLDGEPGELGKDFIRIIGNVFGLNWRPQIIAPLMDQAANRNAFTKAPIETPGMQDMQPFLRAKPGTSETLKAAGMATRNLPESMQVNPVRAEALLRGYLNSWGAYALMATDAVVEKASGNTAPAMRTDQLPVLRRFYAQEPPLRTKYETMFYDILEEAKRLHGTLRELDKTGHSDIADQKEKSPLAGEAKALEHAAKSVQGINQDMRAVRRSDISPEEKRTRLDALTIERNDLLKRSVLDSKAAQWKEQAARAETKLRERAR